MHLRWKMGVTASCGEHARSCVKTLLREFKGFLSLACTLYPIDVLSPPALLCCSTRVYRTQFGGQPFGRRPQQGNGDRSGGLPPQLAQLLQLAPILLLVLITFLSRSSAAPYSLNKTRDYAVAQHTSAHDVPYYVPSARAFEGDYPRASAKRARLEAQVEQQYREELQQACYQERMMQQRYRYYGHKRKAEEMKLERCEELNDRFGARPKTVQVN